MKRYKPSIEIVNNELTGLGGDPYPTMVEDLEGEYVKYDDVCWHRNCEETPVPKDRYLLVRTDKGNIHRVHWSKNFEIYWVNHYVRISIKEITHWMEIPEVEK
jgi:hypothetical protein